MVPTAFNFPLYLDTNLRSLGLSVGNKLCFFLCACICQSFFMQLLVYPLTVFCLGMSEMQVSHICIQRAENSICYVVYRPFSGVGGGSAIYYWLLFQYLLLDVISFFFFSFNLIRYCFAGYGVLAG